MFTFDDLTIGIADGPQNHVVQTILTRRPLGLNTASWYTIASALVQSLNAMFGLQPIETAPRDGTYILLFGLSGYVTTPLRCEVCHYDPEYRPKQPWVTYSGDSFLDSGTAPTHWMPLPGRP